MEVPFFLSEAPVRRIAPYSPISHGVLRVDDRLIVSAIIFVIKNGPRRRDAPRAYGPHKTIYNRFFRWSRLGVEVRHAMLAAGNTPNNAGYTDLLGEVIMDDLAHVVGFFTAVVPNLGLESRRQMEVDLHHKFYAYHALPPGMADTLCLVSL